MGPNATLREQVEAKGLLLTQKPFVSRANEPITIDDGSDESIFNGYGYGYVYDNVNPIVPLYAAYENPNAYPKLQESLGNASHDNSDVSTTQSPHFCAMMRPMFGKGIPAMNSDHGLPEFDGTHDVVLWIEEFERAFSLHPSATSRNPDQVLQTKANLLRAYLAEPAKSRIISEIKANRLDEFNATNLIEAMKFLYDNEQTRAVARANLNRIEHAGDESVASFANRISKAVERAFSNKKLRERRTKSRRIYGTTSTIVEARSIRTKVQVV